MKGKDRSLRKAVSILIILAIALAMPVAQAHATLQVTRRIGAGKLLWSANFESGRHDTYFNAPNQQNIVPGNNPGEVVTSPVHSSMYAGYYYITSNPTGGWVRDYWSVDWGSLGERPTTKDFIVEAWVYVPSVTLTSSVSFITTGFDGYSPITVDIDSQALPHRYLKLWNAIFTDTDGYQTISPKVEFPFDRWVKLDMEVHLKPSTQLSNVILYQDGVKIIDFKSYSYSAQAPTLLSMHFGLYTGPKQQTFAVYNDDLALYDIS